MRRTNSRTEIRVRLNQLVTRRFARFFGQVVAVLFLSFTTICGYCESINSAFVASENYASLAEIKAWTNSKSVIGFGAPQSVEYSSSWIELYVTWNSPYSGRSGVYSNAFVRSKDGSVWSRVDASLFESVEPLAFAYVNPISRTLLYVGRSGMILKTIKLDRK